MSSDDAEVVDLESTPQMKQYHDKVTKDFRMLHDLHTRVQKNTTPLRLPKQSPSFSYSGAQPPVLPFLGVDESIHDNLVQVHNITDEEPPLPSLSELVQSDETFTTSTARDRHDIAPQRQPSHTEEYETSAVFEAAMIGPDDSITLRESQKQHLPEMSTSMNSSFGDEVFDFQAFDGNRELKAATSHEDSVNPHESLASMHLDDNLSKTRNVQGDIGLCSTDHVVTSSTPPDKMFVSGKAEMRAYAESKDASWLFDEIFGDNNSFIFASS